MFDLLHFSKIQVLRIMKLENGHFQMLHLRLTLLKSSPQYFKGLKYSRSEQLVFFEKSPGRNIKQSTIFLVDLNA